MKIRAAVLATSSATTPYALSQALRVQAVELAAPATGEVLVLT